MHDSKHPASLPVVVEATTIADTLPIEVLRSYSAFVDVAGGQIHFVHERMSNNNTCYYYQQ